MLNERVLRFAYIPNFDCFIEKKLPDESCRQCGGILIDFAQCAECKKIISMICKSCRTKTAEQFHSDCLLSLNDSYYFPTKINQNLPSMTLA
ncbi:MAG: hypothetical protein OEM89_04790 [Nitrosopumilus sp.]|nr:hypothetical protein [Nitrosopumilus sp.]